MAKARFNFILLIIIFSSLTAFFPLSSVKLRAKLFQMAAYLTDPICKSHEYFRRFAIEHELRPNSFKKGWIAQQCVLLVHLSERLRSSLFLTLPGVALRSLAVNLDETPFLYFEQPNHLPKQLPSNGRFTLFSWNICFVGAGYSITDGGVLPWGDRIDRIVEKVIDQDADVVCLYETFDTTSAFALYDQLKTTDYGYFYFNIGPRAIGASSGIFVASKYLIARPEFISFPKESQVGRTKYVEKGVFAFDLISQNRSFARIFTTHLQHSEEPEFATQEEIKSREMQMQIILKQMSKEKNKCLVLTGDLNLDDAEYDSSSWHPLFEKTNDQEESLKTWGGDRYCASLMQKKISSPLNLDHTMMIKRTAQFIKTSRIDVRFDGAVFNQEALSDHLGLLSEITIDPLLNNGRIKSGQTE